MLQKEENVTRLWVGYIEYRCYVMAYIAVLRTVTDSKERTSGSSPAPSFNDPAPAG